MYEMHTNELFLGKGKGKGLSVTNEDVSFMDMDAFWKEMESILQAQKEHFMQHITLRYVMSSIISFSF